VSDKNKQKSPDQNTGANPKAPENKPKSINEKLRKKLERLKKDDPNIYPVF